MNSRIFHEIVVLHKERSAIAGEGDGQSIENEKLKLKELLMFLNGLYEKVGVKDTDFRPFFQEK